MYSGWPGVSYEDQKSLLEFTEICLSLSPQSRIKGFYYHTQSASLVFEQDRSLSARVE